MSCGTVELRYVSAIAQNGTSNVGIQDANGASCGAIGGLISHLQVEAIGGTQAIAVQAGQSWSRFDNVSAIARDGSSITAALSLNVFSDARIRNSSFEASNATAAVAVGVDASGSGGAGKALIDGSTVVSPGPTLRESGGFVLRIGASRLDGGPVQTSGSAVCAGVYDEAYAFHASTCP
jgi:hypothetical protein